MKITNGTVEIEGVTYKAFEKFQNGPWKIVKGTRHSDLTVATIPNVKTANQAIKQWLQNLDKKLSD